MDEPRDAGREFVTADVGGATAGVASGAAAGEAGGAAAGARDGDWVEVELTLLEPSDRSADLPPETADLPFRMWVKGFARGEAAVGGQMTVETMTGRLVTGVLTAVNPGYFITYGPPIPELVHVGRDLRARLAAYRAREAAAGPAEGPGEHSSGPGAPTAAGGGRR